MGHLEYFMFARFLLEIRLEAFLYFYQLICRYYDKQLQLTADQKQICSEISFSAAGLWHSWHI